jgi:hypothetical protein
MGRTNAKEVRHTSILDRDWSLWIPIEILL